MTYRIILTLLQILNLSLLFISWKNIKDSKKHVHFIVNWGFFDGMFVWEDAFVISIYNNIFIALTLLVQDIRYFTLAFLVFWLIRGMGETLYFFLQQFHLKKEFPHDIVPDFRFWRHIFGDISPQKQYILSQVSVQIVSASSLFCIILLIINWSNLAVIKWL